MSKIGVAAPRRRRAAAGDHERDPTGDHHRVVGGPFVVAADEGELHRHLERRLVGRPGEAVEDRPEQLLLEVVHHVVHVGQGGRDRGVLVGERVDGEARLHAAWAPMRSMIPRIRGGSSRG